MSRSDFDLTNPVVVMRLACGLFYLPHVAAKVHSFPAILTFFTKAGFPQPLAFLILAGIVEAACAVGLTCNIMVKWTGLMSAGTMVVAAVAMMNVKGIGWLWNLGGVEYLVFWGLASFSLAVNAWKREFSAHGRVWLFAPPAHA